MCCIEQRFVCFQNLGLKAFHADLLAFSSVTGKGSSCRCVNPWHRGGSLLWTAWLQSVTLQDCWGLWVCSQRPLISVGSGSTQTFLNFLLSLERKAWQAVQKHSVVLFGSTLGRTMKDKTRWYPTIKFNLYPWYPQFSEQSYNSEAGAWLTRVFLSLWAQSRNPECRSILNSGKYSRLLQSLQFTIWVLCCSLKTS